MNYLSANEFLVYVHDHLASVSGAVSYESTLHYKKFRLPHLNSMRPDMLQATNAATQPTYVFLMTEPSNLKLFLQAISPSTQ